MRTFLLLATRDIDRDYLYFFNDDDAPQLHGASGITRNYVPKPSFYALAHLYKTLGDFRFSRIVDVKNDAALVYEFAHESEADKRVLVAWCPSGSNRDTTLEIPASDIHVDFPESMPQEAGAIPPVEITTSAGMLHVEIGDSPTYILGTRQH